MQEYDFIHQFASAHDGLVESIRPGSFRRNIAENPTRVEIGPLLGELLRDVEVRVWIGGKKGPQRIGN
jgi:hypothetical protein